MSMITLVWGKCKYREKEKEPRIFIVASAIKAHSSSIALFLCLLLGIQLCQVLIHHQRPLIISGFLISLVPGIVLVII